MMRTFISSVLLIAAAAMLAAQTPARYDRAAEKAFTGTIKSVGAYPADDGSVGVHIDLITDEGIVDVRVAPATFIGKNNFWFFADESLVVVGARVPRDGNGPVWARAVQKGSQVLVLRNDSGTPTWTPPTDGTDGCGVNHPPIQRTTLQ